LTGVNFFAAELVAKRLALLRELVPAATSRALPWFESYADQDRTIRMFLRNAGNEEAMMAPDMIGFMESVV
jgi:hypothetical protein